MKKPRNLQINKRLVIIICVISTPIIVLLSYFFVIGSLVQAIIFTIMEFGLIIFTISYNKLKSERQENSTGKLATLLKGLEIFFFVYH